LLNKADTTEQLAYDFIRQLAFNTLIGNADAHAKNYSIFLDDAPRITPLYDALPLGTWPQYDQRLSMPIGNARYAAVVTPAHWDYLANRTKLDKDKVLEIVSTIANRLAETLDEAYAGIDQLPPEDIVRPIKKNLQRML